MSVESMKFFWGSGSPPCWKPMIVFAEKGLWSKVPNTQIEFSKKQHKEGEILELNPRGQVPTFKDGDLIVNESGAICMYLEEKFSNDSNRLFPSDVNKRAHVYQKMYESANLQSTVAEKLVYYKWRTKEEDRDPEYLKEHTENARKELGRWNEYLKNTDYLCGDSFTMADVFFFPPLAFLVRVGATLAEFPELKKYHDRVAERQAVKETWPPHWKDSAGPALLPGL